MSKRIKLPTLLLITDNPSIRHWIKKYLDVQFFIIEAKTRIKAIEAVVSSQLDFIVLDADFEDENPLELCKEISHHLKNYHTPILLITGKLKKSFRDQALEAGVTDFLSSQLDLEELETRIATGQRTQKLIDKTSDLSGNISKERSLSKDYLKNKFLLHDQAIRFLKEAKEKDVPVTLLNIRIDKYETLQEKDGYLVAEEIQIATSEILERLVDAPDLMIPNADGEFFLLLFDKDESQAKRFAEEIRKEIQKNPFKAKNRSIHLTVSIAIGSVEDEHGLNRMVKTASKALKQVHDTTNLIISLDLEDL